jgi:hypothetical protein
MVENPVQTNTSLTFEEGSISNSRSALAKPGRSGFEAQQLHFSDQTEHWGIYDTDMEPYFHSETIHPPIPEISRAARPIEMDTAKRLYSLHAIHLQDTCLCLLELPGSLGCAVSLRKSYMLSIAREVAKGLRRKSASSSRRIFLRGFSVRSGQKEQDLSNGCGKILGINTLISSLPIRQYFTALFSHGILPLFEERLFGRLRPRFMYILEIDTRHSNPILLLERIGMLKRSPKHIGEWKRS